MNVSSLVALLQDRAMHQPDRVAYRFLQDGEVEIAHLTYTEIDAQARAIGAALQSRGALGQRVLLLYSPGLEFIVGFFGCLYGGAIAVPTYLPRADQSLEKLAAIAGACQAKLAVTTGALFPMLAARFPEQPSLAQIELMVTDTIDPGLGNTYCDIDLDSQNIALLQYTSGSTGSPKGVMLSHGNILSNLAMLQAAFQTTPETRFVSWMPLTHNSGLIGGALLPLYGGFLAIMMSPLAFLQRPWRWLKALSDYQGTLSFAPNFAYELAAAKITPEERDQLDLSPWELAICGAEKVHGETVDKFTTTFAACGFRASAFNPCYGMAENAVFISGQPRLQAPVVQAFDSEALRCNQVRPAHGNTAKQQMIVGCGTTWLGQEIRIVQPDSCEVCPPGTVGEIWVSGPSVAAGYWQQPEATQQTFGGYLNTGEGPFLRSGDLGFLVDDQLFLTGRLKDLIVMHGRNYYPEDIEVTIEKSHPALRPKNGAAFSIEVNQTEVLVIVQEVQATAIAKLNVEEVIQAICQQVSKKHDLSVHGVVLIPPDTIFKTGSGKIQRQTCRAGFLTGTLTPIAQWQQPHTNPEPIAHHLTTMNADDIASVGLQAWVIQQVAQLLAIPTQDLDPQVALVNYGLDSVGAVRLSGVLEAGIGRRLSPNLAWDYPTIDALVGHLSGSPQTSVPSHEAIDLQAEVVLDPEIWPTQPWDPTTMEPPRAVLLTGGTGFLGAFLLKDLLAQLPDVRIYCLTRAQTPAIGHQKLCDNLRRYGLWEADFSDRIEAVPSDLSQPHLGLASAVFAQLSDQIDVIYHSAALLNYVYPYAKFKPSNVLGTQEILRLACQGKPKPLHYISSVAVFESAAYYGQTIVESDKLDHGHQIHLGYSQSKWVAEKIVMIARDRGLPVNIYRPPFISGHSETGVWNTDDVICRLIKGCIQLQAVGDLDFVFDLSPVDYVSQAIVYLSQQPDCLGGNFHLTNPQPIHWQDLFRSLRNAGYALQQLSYEDWQIALENHGRSQNNILYPLLPFFLRKCTQDMTLIELYQEARKPKITCLDTLNRLQAGGITCSAMDDRLLKIYIGYLQNSGFLNA